VIPLSVDDAAALLCAGGVAGIPTDTVYGLACDPTSVAGVERVYAVKHRPAGLELSLLAASADALAVHGDLGPLALALGQRFWPGPLSLVVPLRPPRRLVIPRAGATISVRVPDHDLLRSLLARTGPLASTSANRHGAPPALTAAEVMATFGDELDGVLDGGRCGGVASTIIDVSEVPPRVLRPGPVPGEALRPYLGGAFTHP